jgi:hypothetical protein
MIDALADKLADAFIKALKPKLEKLADEQIDRVRGELEELAEPVERMRDTIKRWLP